MLNFSPWYLPNKFYIYHRIKTRYNCFHFNFSHDRDSKGVQKRFPQGMFWKLFGVYLPYKLPKTVAKPTIRFSSQSVSIHPLSCDE